MIKYTDDRPVPTRTIHRYKHFYARVHMSRPLHARHKYRTNTLSQVHVNAHAPTHAQHTTVQASTSEALLARATDVNVYRCSQKRTCQHVQYAGLSHKDTWTLDIPISMASEFWDTYSCQFYKLQGGIGVCRKHSLSAVENAFWSNIQDKHFRNVFKGFRSSYVHWDRAHNLCIIQDKPHLFIEGVLEHCFPPLTEAKTKGRRIE